MLMILGEPIKRWRCIYRACEARCCRLRRELTLTDIRRITDKTGLPPAKFVKIVANQTVPFTLRRRGGRCVFLGKNFKCQLHDLNAKPILCKIYPLLLRRVIYGDEPIFEATLAEACPGIGKGPTFYQEAVKTVTANAQAYISGLREIIRLRQQGLTAEGLLKVPST